MMKTSKVQIIKIVHIKTHHKNGEKKVTSTRTIKYREWKAK